MADQAIPAPNPRAERSRRAKALLEDPILKGALSALIDRATKDWIETQPEEQEKRERLWHELQAVRNLSNELANIAADAAVRAFNNKGTV